MSHMVEMSAQAWRTDVYDKRKDLSIEHYVTPVGALRGAVRLAMWIIYRTATFATSHDIAALVNAYTMESFRQTSQLEQQMTLAVRPQYIACTTWAFCVCRGNIFEKLHLDFDSSFSSNSLR